MNKDLNISTTATYARPLPKLKVKKLSQDAILPTRAHETDSGLDLYTGFDVTIPAHSTKVIPTNIAIQLPYGFEGQVRPRSGKTLKTKLRVQLGTIDYTYVDEDLGIIVDNISDKAIVVPKHTKLAQLVIAPVSYIQTEEVTEFDTTEKRGGFGSTDKA